MAASDTTVSNAKEAITKSNDPQKSAQLPDPKQNDPHDALPEPPEWLKNWGQRRAGPDITYRMPWYNPATGKQERSIIVSRGGFIVSKTPDLSYKDK
jgi:hypothetical protein